MIKLGDAIPHSGHIVRYVGKMNFRDDGTVDGAAFRKKPNEPRPSVNWLEAFEGTTAQQVARVREIFRLKIGKFARFAELHIGTIIQHSKCAVLSVVSMPNAATDEFEADPSHAEISGLSANKDCEKIICDLIAECVTECHAARPPTKRVPP